MSSTSRNAALVSALLLAGCPEGGSTNDGLEMVPGDVTAVAFDESTTYTISDLDDGQAYRITLVHEDNLSPDANGAATFQDADGNGAADAGPSETVALITAVQGDPIDAFKTVPGVDDDPANPSGVLPIDEVITVTVTGVGPGSVYPVAYTNDGESTFLEINGNGDPIEPYVVGGALTVTNGPMILSVTPNDEQSVGVAETVVYSASGLDDSQAYRITLVVADNVTVRGNGTGMFIDDDDNGAADAGGSENIGLITSVNGVPQTGAKTVPGGDDDPANPSGVFPVSGTITVTVTAVGAGTVYPVFYENGGDSTFLEVGSALVPKEAHGVGGAFSVQ